MKSPTARNIKLNKKLLSMLKVKIQRNPKVTLATLKAKVKTGMTKNSRTRRPQRNISKNRKLCISLSTVAKNRNFFSPQRTMRTKTKTGANTNMEVTKKREMLSPDESRSYLLHSYMIGRVNSKIKNNRIINGRFVSPLKLFRKVQGFQSMNKTSIIEKEELNGDFTSLPKIAKGL
ncbi:unnamed protein product [Moneuplotes crassus]|uniref:Uncharacterized protein n=1 Tax=Euplotes crassus TaxID=5936 RepID=A0AAD1UL83_EUPCR|nr:unnamed protein product [Moneuplotes crassus]